jgi:hypothetical protein
MDPVVVSVNITDDPDLVEPAASPHTYIGIAEAFLPGVQILATRPASMRFAIGICIGTHAQVHIEGIQYRERRFLRNLGRPDRMRPANTRLTQGID